MTPREDRHPNLTQQARCRHEAEAALAYRERLPALAERIIQDCSIEECHTHIGFEPIPSRQAVIEIIERARELLFPGFFSPSGIDPASFPYAIGQATTALF